MLTLEQASLGFAAAGSGPILEVLMSLVRAGPDGLTLGDVQERVGLPASTLGHHLRLLAESGVIEQEKRGRTVVNRAVFDRIEALAAFLLHECCTDSKSRADGEVSTDRKWEQHSDD